jgi:TRAP-type C4-dicarboxylate transport system substrate-binding protein
MMVGWVRTMAVMSLAAALLGCARPATSGAYEVTYASPYPPSHPFSRADIDWIKWVESRSGGRLRIKPSWAGALISSDESMIELRHGIADMGLITPIYERGGVQMLRAQSGFYGGVASIGEQVEVYDCLAASTPEFAKELEGLHVLAVQGGNLPGVVTRTRPIRTLEDLKGLRLRAPVELIPILRTLGADPVNMPMNDVYSALAKGVIDGVVAPADTLQTLHFAEVAHYFWQVRIARGAYAARAMSNQAYRRLPPDLQRLMDDSRRIWEAALDRQISSSVAAGEAFGRKHGVNFAPASAADQTKWNIAYNAGALDSARGLKRYGLDGETVFRRAQTAVSEIRAGRFPACAFSSPSA